MISLHAGACVGKENTPTKEWYRLAGYMIAVMN